MTVDVLLVVSFRRHCQWWQSWWSLHRRHCLDDRVDEAYIAYDDRVDEAYIEDNSVICLDDSVFYCLWWQSWWSLHRRHCLRCTEFMNSRRHCHHRQCLLCTELMNSRSLIGSVLWSFINSAYDDRVDEAYIEDTAYVSFMMQCLHESDEAYIEASSTLSW